MASGEPRLVRLDDYWLDMGAAAHMLVTRHQDRPGTMGTIGRMLGKADVNISAMHLARSQPRADALMILALDDAVPADVAAASAPTGSAGPVADPPRLTGVEGSLVLVRHGESTWVAEERFQGQGPTALGAG